MLIASLVITPISGWSAAPALVDPTVLVAGVGVGVTSSVIPYVCDQLAMARLSRATYSLMVSLLPATATIVGILVLGQIPSSAEIVGVGLVVAAVALHHERGAGEAPVEDTAAPRMRTRGPRQQQPRVVG
jgi:inner membrane transporter RhtA